MFRYLLSTKILSSPDFEEVNTEDEWRDRLCGDTVDMIDEGGHVLLDIEGRMVGVLFSTNGEIPGEMLATHGLQFYDEL